MSTRRHLHVTHTHGKDRQNIESEHEAWHFTKEACVFCGRKAWHSCPVFPDGRKGSINCYGRGA